MEARPKKYQFMESHSGTKLDFMHSWQMLKENYKAFLGTEIFAILASIIAMAISFTIIQLVYYLSPALSFSEYVRENYILVFLIIIILFVSAFTRIFISCQNGLAHDIMNSGEMFTEFKQSFKYFKKFWWQYLILSTIIFGFTGFFNSFNFRIDLGQVEPFHKPNLIFSGIILPILGFIWMILFISTFPSITEQGSLKNAFIENFRILKTNPKRLIKTFGTYFLIFFVPNIILGDLFLIYQNVVLLILVGLSEILLFFIGYPLLFLLAAGIYYNIKFERIKPLSNE